MKEEDTQKESSLRDQEQEDFFDIIENDDKAKIEHLLKKNLKIWTYRNKDNDNCTVLHFSVFKKLFDIASKLIEYCKEHNNGGLKDFINEKNDQGITAIHYASFRGDIKIIRLLIDNGADVFSKTKRNLNVIHYACQGKSPNSLMYFYIFFKKNNNNEGLKLITDQDEGGSTPLHWAAYSNCEDVLLYLINLNIFKSEREKQEYIDKQDKHGNTALHLSINNRSIRIVMRLLQSGASSDIKDKNKRTPLELAHEKKQKEIEEIIKNNQSIQFFNIKAPVKQIKKSPKNIICVFFFQILATLLLFFLIIPFSFNTEINGIYNNINNTDINNNIKYYYYNSLFIAYVVFLILFFILYIILLLIEPGTIKSESFESLEQKLNFGDANSDLLKYCYKCYTRKNINIKHCIICDRCYNGFDHHCYWINKCVAKKNYKLFMLFLIETFIYLGLILNICIFGFIKFATYENKDKQICFHFLDKDINLCIIKLISDKIGDKLFIYLLINIIMTVLDLFFLIPESILFFLSIIVYCSNYKANKYKEKNLEKDNLLMSNDTSLEIDD